MYLFQNREENELLTIKPFKSKTVNRKSVTSTSNEHDYYQTLGNNNHNRFDFYYDAPETFDHILAGSKWNDDTKKPKSIVDIRPFMVRFKIMLYCPSSA